MGIIGLTKAAVRTGHHPTVWKRASGVLIRKPGKEDYTTLKLYRTISLLSCLGKVVEKVVAELQSDEAENEHYSAMASLAVDRKDRPSTQQPSWSTEHIQHGKKTTSLGSS